jgi:chaperonin cofactor prefoldin
VDIQFGFRQIKTIEVGVMISKDKFDELVANTTKYLQDHSMQIARLERQIRELNDRLTHMENRRKPGPKPKQEAA